jgi:epoxyqueuosine reductase
VAVALGNLQTPEAVPALSKALRDHEPIVRQHVAWALGRIKSEDARDALQKRLEVETENEVREEIQEALTPNRQI